MNKTLVITSLAVCVASGYVYAVESGIYGTANSPSTATAGESPAVHRTFLRLDVNKDGYIERNEAKSNATLTRDFFKVAKSGKLSESEFSAWEVQQGTASSGMTKAKHESMPMQNTPAGSMGSPKAGGGNK